MVYSETVCNSLTLHLLQTFVSHDLNIMHQIQQFLSLAFSCFQHFTQVENKKKVSIYYVSPFSSLINTLNISTLLASSKNTADLPAYVTNCLWTDTGPQQEFSLFTVSFRLGCYVCPLLIFSLMNVDSQSSSYTSWNKSLICHLWVLQSTLVVCLCYFTVFSGRKGTISDSEQSNCVFACGRSLSL